MPDDKASVTDGKYGIPRVTRRGFLGTTGGAIMTTALTTAATASDDTDADDDDSSESIGIRHDRYPGVLGGGEGMDEQWVNSAEAADVVVENMAELRDATAAASRGDVIYVAGEISGHLSVSTPGVTIAGNRGIGSDGRWSNASLDQNAPDLRLDGLAIDCGWSDFCAINDSGLEVVNCLVENHDGYAAFTWNTGDSAAVFSHSEFRHWNHYGLQVRYNWHDVDNRIRIQYCDFHDLGQHVIQGGYGWFHLRDNHFHGSLNMDPDHVLEVRGSTNAPTPCGSSGGNAVVEHNLNEMRGSSGGKSRLVTVRCIPSDRVVVRNNVSPGNSPPAGGCHQNGTSPGWADQLVFQNTATSGSLENVEVSNNQL